MSAMPLRSHIPEWVKMPVRLMRDAHERQDWRHELRRRFGGEPPLPAGPIRKVVVICHGNVCRSPFSHRDLARRAPHVEVRSAGLAAPGGDPPEAFASSVAAKLGVPLDGHLSTRFSTEHVEWADLIIAMTGRHLHTMAETWPESVEIARLLGDYLPTAPHLLPDPWGQEELVFERVFERITRADARVAELLAEDARSWPDAPTGSANEEEAPDGH